MLGRERRPEPDSIELTIGASVTLRGDIRCEGSIRIDGVVEAGSIETLGNVIIASEARVVADIRAKAVSVAGTYKGNMDAQRVELLDGGRMWGVIRAESFYLDEEGFLQAELVMQSEHVHEEPANPVVATADK